MRFSIVELGNEVTKSEFEEREPALRLDLLNAQFDLRDSGRGVLIVLMGDDRRACQELCDLVHEWLDARHVSVDVFLEPAPSEAVRPAQWRYWQALPPKGRMSVYLGAWAFDAVAPFVLGQFGEKAFEERLVGARRFERTLAADGMVVLKFWMHTTKKVLKKRLKKAADERQGWRLNDRERLVYDNHDELVAAGERLVEATDTAQAPWHVVESTDARFRDLSVMTTILGALQKGAAYAQPVDGEPATDELELERVTVLDAVDLTLALERDDYEEQLERLQSEIGGLALEASERGVSSVLAFEGWDAAGKGGAIRRVTHAIAAQHVRVIPIGAPTDEEQARHYLWRFWRHVPRDGRMTIFDRSWYGRVLVERVEGLTPAARWRQAYGEINELEAQLARSGMLVRKFWLHLDPDEQLRRFQAREKTPYKKYKITADDYRNRERWDDYVLAVDEMIARTDSAHAPWVVVPANDKRYARVRVLREVRDGLESALRRAKKKDKKDKNKR